MKKYEKRQYQECTRCVMDTTDSMITFSESGECDHCQNFDENIKPNWNPDSEESNTKLKKIADEIKKKGSKNKYDCIIGISGGVDSSYLLYYAKEILGLRPLVYSVDTGWNLDVANNNIKKMVEGLGLELHTEKVNWEEMKDLQLAFFKSQVPYQDTPQDHVIFAALYNFAVKSKIKYVLTGGNFSTECVREPKEWVYQNDVRQIKDIHKKFGKAKLNTLPMCGMFKYRLYYRYFKGMKVIKPLDLMPYTKELAISTLSNKFNWQPYANKHFESIFTRFYEGYWLVKKFGFDKRKAHFSSLILTEQLTKEKADEILRNPPYPIEDAMKDMEYICQKLEISKEEFIMLMKQPNKSYKDYKRNILISLAIKIATFFGIEKRQFR